MKMKVIKMLIISIVILVSLTLFLRYKSILSAKSYSQLTKVSCYLDDSSKKYKGHKPCDKTFNRDDWIDVVTSNNSKNNKVILYFTGGPSAKFVYRGLNGQVDFKEKEKFIASYLNGKKDLNFVVLKDMWHMKAANWASSYKLKEHDVVKEKDEYITIVNQIVQSYVSEGKKVVLVGHSFGAFKLQEYLRRFGNKNINQTIILHGRLHFGNKGYKAYKKRMVVFFNLKDKVIKNTLVTKLYNTYIKIMHPIEYGITNNAAPYLLHDYTKSLDSNILSANSIIWTSSRDDILVGHFTKTEVAFAKKHGRFISVDIPELEKLQETNEVFPLGALGHGATVHYNWNKHWINYLKN